LESIPSLVKVDVSRELLLHYDHLEKMRRVRISLGVKIIVSMLTMSW